MFSKDMRRIYNRFLILGLLSMCLFVFGYSDQVGNAAAMSVCTQDCEASEARCNDACATSCSADSTDAECDSCVLSCNRGFESCMRHAIICSNGGSTYTPACQVGYADHCPIDSNGHADCTNAHSGYYLLCTTLGNAQCVACPDHQFCQGSNGIPPCF